MIRCIALLTMCLLPAVYRLAMGSDFSPAVPMPAAPLQESRLIQKIALGSCFHPQKSDQIFFSIAATNPDLFLFIGDNVYAEDESDDPALESLREAYGLLAASKQFAALRTKVPLLVTWDDHDYGKNDAGGDWETKYTSEAPYELVWAVSDTDQRANRDGVYHAHTAGPDGRRVQFILLDTRFFRTPLTTTDAKRSPGHGPYIPSNDPDQNLLGDDQWQWLEQQLSAPADLRIVATSIQMVATAHNWESWQLLPREKQRFFDLLERTGAGGVVLVSGDRHLAAIYRQDDTPYPVYELTSSSLNLPLSDFVADIQEEPGPNRIGSPYYDANFGLIEIDWEERQLTLSVRDEKGVSVRSVTVSLDQLK